MAEHIIELQDVTKYFDDNLVIDHVSFYVNKGEFITFLGPSGCGKTTTLRMIAGFDLPTSGKILLNGEDISRLPPNKRPVNTVFQRYALFPHLNVYENIAFGLKCKKVLNTYRDESGKEYTKKEKLTKKEIREKVGKALSLVDLEGFEKRAISTLSGGQQQRRRSCCSTSLSARSISKCAKRCRSNSKRCTDGSGSPLSMSRTTRKRRSRCRIPSSSWRTASYSRSAPPPIFTTNRRIRSFCGKTFACLDKFEPNEPVDVVVRPEDIKMCAPEAGALIGEVTSVVFKGIHYEITAAVGKYELVINSTESRCLGEKIGMNIDPDGIHLMKPKYTTNVFDGVITKRNTVAFADGEFECDITQLYPGSRLDEEEYLVTANGERLDLTGTQVKVEVGLNDIEISDDAEAGGTTGKIISIIYKGDHYRLIVRTEEEEEDFVFATDDLWNENDLVSVIIPKEKIKLTLKAPEEKKR